MSRTFILRDGRGEHRAAIESDGRISIDGDAVEARTIDTGMLRVGAAQRRAWVAAAGDVRWVFLDGDVFEIEVLREGRRRAAGTAHATAAAPMPATVVRVDVAPGAAVHRGDTLIILEAMKMELPIRASVDGVVKAVYCRPGDLVQPGVPLVDME